MRLAGLDTKRAQGGADHLREKDRQAHLEDIETLKKVEAPWPASDRARVGLNCPLRLARRPSRRPRQRAVPFALSIFPSACIGYCGVGVPIC